MFEITKFTESEIKQLLKNKREYIKQNPDYYGDGQPSIKIDYIWYKKFITKGNY